MMGVVVWGCEGVQIGMTTWDMTPTHRGFDTFLGFYGASEDCMVCLMICAAIICQISCTPCRYRT